MTESLEQAKIIKLLLCLTQLIIVVTLAGEYILPVHNIGQGEREYEHALGTGSYCYGQIREVFWSCYNQTFCSAILRGTEVCSCHTTVQDLCYVTGFTQCSVTSFTATAWQMRCLTSLRLDELGQVFPPVTMPAKQPNESTASLFTVTLNIHVT